MRKRVIVLLVLLLACGIALMLVLRRAGEQRRAESPVPLNPLSAANRGAVSVESPMQGSAEPVGLAPTVPIQPSVEGSSNATYQGLLQEWQAPIDFYGRVVDENGDAVQNVSVAFRWTETPEEEGVRTSSTESGADGTFSLRHKLGRSLTVSVSKEGYYASRGGLGTYLYALPNSAGPFTPDPSRPVVFLLKKRGTGVPLVATDFPGFGRIEQLRRDGTAVGVDLLKGQRVAAGEGQLQLQFWRGDAAQGSSRYDWRLRISVPGGGLLQTREEFAFEAPESGYQTSLDVDMPVTREGWQSELRLKCFLRLANGCSGRIELYLLAWNGVFTIQSFVNPSGSRNLEAK